MELISDEAKQRADSLWEIATRVTAAATERLRPESDATPAERADIDQKQENVFDTTARLARVSGEIVGVASGALAEAEQLDCAAADVAEGQCPKLQILVAANPRIQELIQELHATGNE